MKIGILTHWWSEDNYGQILQCYALQKYLRDKGHDAYLIRYDPRKDRISTPLWEKIQKILNPVELYKFLSFRLLKQKRKMVDVREKKNNTRYFNVFRSKYIIQSEKIYYYYNELVEDPPAADAYIVGSDQVWNTFGVPINVSLNRIKAFLLNFGNSTIKRIAYAASFGKEKLDRDSIEIFTSLLQKFDYISVREKSGLDICKKCGIDHAEWVPDPTLLLDVDVYRTLYKDEPVIKPDKPYCFLYILKNEFSISIQSIYDWADKKGIDVIYITGNSKQDTYRKTYSTVPEWIYLIEHAEYVITNSYHCSIFSLLFKKKFGVISLKGENNMGMNNRFDSLFQWFEIEERFIDSDFNVINKEINWELVSSVLQSSNSSFNDMKIL